MSETVNERHVCITGTAPTWRDAPWDNPAVEFWCLNDFYVLKPPRADRWFDLHPFEHFHFSQPGKKVLSQDVPPGSFIRPQGHIEFLKAQSIPVYVQDASLLGSPSARTFPKAEVEAAVGPYFASSPAWMLGLALLEGVTDLHVYGIHLATEWEYLKQKPNFLFLLGLAAGRGVRLHLPKTAPLLRESHQYAFQPDPDLPKVAIQKRIEGYQAQLAIVAKQMKVRTRDPNLRSRRAWLQAQIGDAQLALQAVIAARSPVGV